MPFGIGPLELIIVLVIVLVIFGPKRLPGLGRSLGSGMREFKDSLSGKGEDADREEPADGEPARVEPKAAAAPAKGGETGAAEEQVSGERRG
jgi:sec-independent protein translocase protein TatA